MRQSDRSFLWRITFLELLVVPLVTITTACQHGTENLEIELWLIDPYAVVLYRHIDGNKEQIIPIHENEDMKRFIVVDKEEYLRYLLNKIEREDKK